ncbi:MAG: hypothetical protein K8F91_19545, partial [Candidatus Obscuribacterales bacterium]|nr:hypothetical protein [Candidatus Obscuribacterales bacterium]
AVWFVCKSDPTKQFHFPGFITIHSRIRIQKKKESLTTSQRESDQAYPKNGIRPGFCHGRIPDMEV